MDLRRVVVVQGKAQKLQRGRGVSPIDPYGARRGALPIGAAPGARYPVRTTIIGQPTCPSVCRRVSRAEPTSMRSLIIDDASPSDVAVSSTAESASPAWIQSSGS